MRALYVDLDGTLLGPNGSLLHGGDGAPSLLGARAIEACLRAGVEIVLMSGRRKDTVSIPARMLGQRSYIFEAGSCVVIDGEEHWLTGDLLPGENGTVHDQIAATGAPELLLEHFAGRFEHHDPWHLGREVSHLFRGLIEAGDADALLERHGHAGLRLVDNGAASHGSAALAHLPQVRVYHLVPAGVSKARGVAVHMRARGLAREDCVAVGDSREDLEAAAAVGSFWLVANALERDPSLRDAPAVRGAKVRVAEGAYGAGVYEAVVTTLAERR